MVDVELEHALIHPKWLICRLWDSSVIFRFDNQIPHRKPVFLSLNPTIRQFLLLFVPGQICKVKWRTRRRPDTPVLIKLRIMVLPAVQMWQKFAA